ncbi:MAG: 30S ribosomal protein S2 [Rickettsiaceae bacterium]
MSNLPKVSVSDLLDAGIHFGHKTSRWNPKMEPYIYGTKDNIHIMDLQQTVPLLQIALKKIYETVKSNGKVLFVSSKVQATELVAEYAQKCDQYYINHRWLGGILTNWVTISKSIKKLDNIEKVLDNAEDAISYTKKELLDLTRKKEKLIRSFAGIRNIGGRPDLVVVIDTNKEHLAIKEAVKLSIPIVAVVDSNSNPDNIDFPIPGNDDAIRSIRLYCSLFADAALAGIQDSLRDSGVDVGSVTKAKKENTMDGVKKIDKTAKVSKAKPSAKDAATEVKNVKKDTVTEKTSKPVKTATDSVAQ